MDCFGEQSRRVNNLEGWREGSRLATKAEFDCLVSLYRSEVGGRRRSDQCGVRVKTVLEPHTTTPTQRIGDRQPETIRIRNALEMAGRANHRLACSTDFQPSRWRYQSGLQFWRELLRPAHPAQADDLLTSRITTSLPHVRVIDGSGLDRKLLADRPLLCLFYGT